jgi:hypothetical protein
MNDKKSLRIIIGLLCAILIHNLYLNFELLQVKRDAEEAKHYSSAAKEYASEAASYANEAVDYSRNAADYARNAADAAFANNCNYCP